MQSRGQEARLYQCPQYYASLDEDMHMNLQILPQNRVVVKILAGDRSVNSEVNHSITNILSNWKDFNEIISDYIKFWKLYEK